MKRGGMAALAFAGLAGACATTTPPKLISGFITDEDYPSTAIREELEGMVTMGLTIGTDGGIENCAIIRSSGHQVLDEASCGLFTRRFRFQPAMRGGRAVPGRTTQKIVWRLPDA